MIHAQTKLPKMSQNSTAINERAKLLHQYDNWLTHHLDDLIDKYPGKIIAVINDQVVAVGDTYQEIYKPFLESDLEEMPLVIKVPHPDEVEEMLI